MVLTVLRRYGGLALVNIMLHFVDRMKIVRVDLRKLALGLTACSNGLQSKENVEVVVVVDS